MNGAVPLPPRISSRFVQKATLHFVTLKSDNIATNCLAFLGFHGYPPDNKFRILRNTVYCCFHRSLPLTLADGGESYPHPHKLSTLYLDTTSPPCGFLTELSSIQSCLISSLKQY
jgi:hypothetical protein